MSSCGVGALIGVFWGPEHRSPGPPAPPPPPPLHPPVARPRSRHQFVQALYLIDCVKRGMAVPAALPPGPFPPVAGTVNLGSMQGPPSDIYSGATLVIPPMVPRQAYHPQPAAGPLPFASQVPGLPADRLATLPPHERARLEGEREAALRAEEEQRRVGGVGAGVWMDGGLLCWQERTFINSDAETRNALKPCLPASPSPCAG